MMLPTAREWLYSCKTFAAAMLALGIGFAADLERPYWALATVYIASQPTAAGTRGKALYRLVGTVLGATAALILVPPLVDAPVLLTAALSAWVGLCLTVSLLDRTPRGYASMLAGYTAAIIGFPSVDAPGAIWDVAVARTEEIGLGILCAALVSTLVFPTHLGPAIAARSRQWLQDARLWAAEVLGEVRPGAETARARHSLAADAVDLGALATQLSYDAPRYRASLAATEALHARLIMLTPLLSSIADRLAALRAQDGLSPAWDALLNEAASWVANGTPARLPGLRARLAAVQQQEDAGQDWGAMQRAGLAMRLSEVVTLVDEAARLYGHIKSGTPGLPRLQTSETQLATAFQFADFALAAHSGLSAAFAVAAVCAIWIATAWPEGAVAAQMTAIAVCFFATRDDPTPAILMFMKCAIVGVVIDAIYLFAVLPRVDGFPLLAACLAPVFILFGLMAARPATAALGTPLALITATLLALQKSYGASFDVFINGGLATVLGMVVAAVVTSLVRSVSTEFAAWRLVRATWADLAEAAHRRGLGDRAAFAGKLLERIGLVVQRLGQGPARNTPDAQRLHADLRIGLNIVDLRRARHGLGPDAVLAIDAALDALSAYYRALIAGDAGELRALALRRVDAALAELAIDAPSAARRDAQLGLVGVRLGLAPDAAPPALPDKFYTEMTEFA